MRGFVSVLCVLACSSLATAFIDKTVYQYMVDSGYTSFDRLLMEANLAPLLNGPGPVTVFVPDNTAMYAVDGQLMFSLAHNSVQLSTVMRYHIVEGFMLTPQLLSAVNVTTYEGQILNATKNGSVTVLNNSTHVLPSTSDVICNNGIVHEVDSLMLPPVFGMNNVAQVVIMRDDLFEDFFMFLLLTDLSEILTTGEYTLFAPVNAAWGKYVEKIIHPNNITNMKHIYEEMLKYHIVPGERTSSMLQDGQTLYTLHGYPIHVAKSDNGVRLDHRSNVIQADIGASNGVVHAIDEVLFPDDLYQQLLKEYEQTHPDAGN